MGKTIYKIRTSVKKIALTFDDGPDPKNTPLLLDILKQFDAKATFFVVGRKLKKYPDLAKRIIAEGHEFGNHTYSHPNLAKLDFKNIYDELRKTEKIIRKITGQKPVLFRPPFLSYNKTALKVSRRFGYLMIMRSIETSDFRRPGVKKIVKAVMSRLNKGKIVLLHDSGGNRKQTVEAVEIILKKCKRREYQCVSVSNLLESKKKRKATVCSRRH